MPSFPFIPTTQMISRSDREDILFNHLELSHSALRWKISNALVEAIDTSTFNCNDLSSLINNEYGVNKIIPRLINIYKDPQYTWGVQLKKRVSPNQKNHKFRLRDNH